MTRRGPGAASEFWSTLPLYAGGRLPESHTGSFTNSDSDGDGYSYNCTNADSFANSHGHSYGHGHTDSHGHSDSDGDGYSYNCTNADSFANSHGHSYGHGHSDSDGDGYANGDRYSHTHSYRHSHGYRNSDGYSHTNCDRDSLCRHGFFVAAKRQHALRGFCRSTQQRSGHLSLRGKDRRRRLAPWANRFRSHRNPRQCDDRGCDPFNVPVDAAHEYRSGQYLA